MKKHEELNWNPELAKKTRDYNGTMFTWRSGRSARVSPAGGVLRCEGGMCNFAEAHEIFKAAGRARPSVIPVPVCGEWLAL
jgi:hypothetical protein